MTAAVHAAAIASLRGLITRVMSVEFNYRRITLISAFLFTYLTAIVLGAGLLYLMCATFASLVIVAWLISRMSLQHVRVERFFSPSAVEGDEIEIRLRVHHRGRLPRVFVTVREGLPKWVTPAEEHEQHVIPLLLPERPVHLSQRVVLEKRGCYAIGPITLAGNDPLGLFAVPTKLPSIRELIVYPRTVPLKGLGFVNSGGEGTRVSPRQIASVKADGTEFHGIREYIPGDELRRIHWKSTAHRGEFSVIQYEDSLASEVTLFLDLHARVHTGRNAASTLEVGIRIVASIVRYLLEHGVAVQVIADNAFFLPPSIGCDAQHLHRIMDGLARAELRIGRTIDALCETYATSLSRGSSVVVITPDRSSATLQACSILARTGNPVTCFLLDADAFAAAESMAGVTLVARHRRVLSKSGGRAGLRREDEHRENDLSVLLRLSGIRTLVISPETDLAAALECT